MLRDDDPAEVEFAVVIVRAINSRRVERGDTQEDSWGVGKCMLELFAESTATAYALTQGQLVCSKTYVGHVRLKYAHCMCTQVLESGYPSDGVLHRGGGFRNVHKPFFDANLGKKIRVSILRVGVSASLPYRNLTCQLQ